MKRLVWLAGLCGLAISAHAQIDARMLRFPDVSDSQITFVFAGDIWVAPKNGGTAHRLSSPPGEELFPRFSPDGTQIAFSGNYDGNTDIYVVPVTGGMPMRITHHPMNDRLLGWYPDGQSLLYASSMASGRQRFNQLYRVEAEGGLPEKLPVPYGEVADLSPDGRMLAYTTRTRDFRTWKRYRGGMNPDIWLFDLGSYESENVTNNEANDSHPMWHGETLYYLSDAGLNQRANLWAYDTRAKQHRQLTDFDDFDIHFPAIGPSDIVFEAGGRLFLMDLASENVREINIEVVTDEGPRQTRVENVADMIQNGGISPTGKRAVFEARGEVFTVPAEHGIIRNLTHASGSAERYPTWSPDGEWIAYWSDASGEYELTIQEADGTGEPQRLSDLGAGYRYRPYWSPDSKKLAFVDQTMKIHVFDRVSRKDSVIDQALDLFHGGLNGFQVSWSPDSRWIAYDRTTDQKTHAIFLYDTQTSQLHQLTSGYYGDAIPAFDPDGNYLYFLSNRSLQPSYSDLDNSWVYVNTTNVVAVPLRTDVASPLAPRNDEEGATDDEEEEDDEDDEKEEDDKANVKAKPVRIDLDGFESRLVVLPPSAGNYTDLYAASGKVVYRRRPRTGAGEDASPIVFYDLEEREEKTVMDDADGFDLSADGKKLLVVSNGKFGIVDLEPEQTIETPLRTSEMEMTVDPVAEWKQIFNDAWRLERDFFYDPAMHGVDWEAMRVRYGALIDDAATRWDVHYVLGELIAELNASHTYRGGGDTEDERERDAGLLGVDWERDGDAYRIAHIVDGAAWDSEVRSPLRQPGIDVDEGAYLLAVNGVPVDASKDPWAAFQGLADEAVVLTISDRPTMDGARKVLVETLNPQEETRLRHLEWIEGNRKKVEELSDGKVGYVYVPSTGLDGQTELVRQFMAQYAKPALVIDERFNSGGQIPDRFIELLNRPPLAFWAVRDGQTWQWPPVAHFGPKVMLINGWSGSGGDAFPFYFKEAGLGPLVGTRTWGGLIGISGAPPLIDGGGVTVPTFRMFGPDGEWFPEGYGVEPDIEVIDDPTLMARGRDPQLERAVEVALERLETTPPVNPPVPARESRVPATASGTQ